jgi:amino acid adenylation domain-containing protein
MTTLTSTTAAVTYNPFSGGDLLYVYPPTEPQKEIWASVITGGMPANCAFNESISLALEGAFDERKLQKALQQVVAAHDALRSVFTPDGSKVLVYRDITPTYRFIDLAQSPGDTVETHRKRAVNDEFDLVQGPLFRVTVIRESASKHTVIFAAHHIVCDGWSLGILLEDLGRAYSALVEGRDCRLEPHYFSRYAERQNIRMRAGAFEKSESYWLNIYRESQPLYDLPTDFARPSLRTFDANRIDHVLSETKVAALKKLGAKNGASFVATLFATFSAWLAKITDHEDLAIGMPAAGQSIDNEMQLIGHCVNMLPVRTQVDMELPFSQYLKKAKGTLYEIYDHQELTFGRLLQRLNLKRDASRIPLIPVIFNFDKGLSNLNFAGARAWIYSNPRDFETFEMFLNAAERGKEVVLELQYNINLFKAETINNRLAGYERFIDALLQEPDGMISSLNYLSDADVSLLDLFNQTDIDFPHVASINALVEATAARKPDATALVFDTTRLSYSELNCRANRLARHLRSLGVVNETLVGVCMDRQTDLIVTLLAILKAGGTYVPIDPKYPLDRIAYIIEDANAGIVVTRSGVRHLLENAKATIVDVDTLGNALAAYGDNNLDNKISDQQLAYLIYTSGSTGKPKGVMLTHANAISLIQWAQTVYSEKDLDGVLAATSVCFDLSVFEIFVTLSLGGKVILAENVLALPDIAARNEVVLVNTVPSAIATLQDQNAIPDGVRIINLAGEALPAALVDKLYSTAGVQKVYDLYGPSEDTTYSTWALREKGKPATIGKPLLNTRAYILNKKGQRVPPGVVGELYLSGTGVTKGYRNREDLTRERYLPNPFSAGGKYARMYRTGDLARYMPNGDIEYLGRIDHQVKIRGFRIELGEIQAVINKVSGVRESLVITADDPGGNKMLVAYLASTQPANILIDAVRAEVRAQLPEFMMPSAFIVLEKFPLTPNGKIDRNALPGLDSAATPSTATSVAAADHAWTKTEELVRKLWQETLHHPAIGPNDDFFLSGGHSLIGIQMLGKLRAETGVELKLNELFSAPTIVQLAKLVDSRNTKGGEKVAIPPRKDPHAPAPVALQQQRLWYLQSFDPENESFNLPAAWRYTGKLDANALQRAFDEIIARHDSLRAVIIEHEGEPCLALLHSQPVDLTPLPMPGATLEERRAAANAWCDQDTRVLFDLATGPLVRVRLLQIDPEEHILSLSLHHVIFDGWSFDLILHELATLYNAFRRGEASPLPPLPISYLDYSTWQRQWFKGEIREQHLKFWLQQLGGELPVLQLPTDFPRPDVLPHAAHAVTMHLTKEQITGLTLVGQRQGATFYMTMMALYQTLLARYAQQDEVVVGTPISGRNWAEINQLLGFFVNTLVLRQKLDMSGSFDTNLRSVRETCVAAFSHQHTPFEALVEAINPPRDTSRTPIFQTMFLFQDIRNRTDTLDGITIDQVQIDRTQIQSDLEFWIKQKEDGAIAQIEYNTSLFRHDTIERMVSHFIALIDAVIKDSTIALDKLPMLTNEERKTLLLDWNDTFDASWQPTTLLDLLAPKVASNADKIAVQDASGSLTYRQLDEKASQFANYLTHLGVKPRELVGVSLQRSVMMVPVLLGILRTGAAYVPLDPDFPAERLQFMVADAGVNVLISEISIPAKLFGDVPHLVQIDAASAIADIAAQPSRFASAAIDPESLAYVIYTSGSTGKPKGVTLPHRAMANFVQAMTERPGLAASDKLAAVTTLSFDIAVLELFLPLAVGATTYIVSREQAVDGRTLGALLEQESITCMQATPATWRLLMTSKWAGRKAFKALVGGEALPRDLAQWLLECTEELWNMYGPTETTVWSTCHLVLSADQNAVVGQPIKATSLYVLDKNGDLAPVGVTGELCIGGLGVAKGYLNRAELTAEKFIANPFAGELARAAQDRIIYRTGDAVRWREDGTIQYFNRIDNQVKIRGYRVELGDIEAALSTLPQVQQSVAIVREDQPGDQRLVAYFIAAPGQSLTSTEMRRQLKTQLPPYMIPQYLVALEAFPLTPNAKIDRKKLPVPYDLPQQGHQFVAPQTPNEEVVARIWRALLNVDKIGRNDNFFEVGGHSLLSMNFIVQLRNETGFSFTARDVVLNDLSQLASMMPDTTSATATDTPEQTTNSDDATQEKRSTWQRIISKLKN